MRVEIDSNGKVTVFDEDNNIVAGVISGTVHFGVNMATKIEIETYMTIGARHVDARGKT